MKIQKIDYPNYGGYGNGPNPRIETGPVKFGGDWTGLFIRGDDAINLGINLGIILAHLDKQVDKEPSLHFAILTLEELMDQCLEVIEK